LEVGITYNRTLCNNLTGPARFRLNMVEMALELKRVWHPCFTTIVGQSAWSRHCYWRSCLTYGQSRRHRGDLVG